MRIIKREYRPFFYLFAYVLTMFLTAVALGNTDKKMTIFMIGAGFMGLMVLITAGWFADKKEDAKK